MSIRYKLFRIGLHPSSPSPAGLAFYGIGNLLIGRHVVRLYDGPLMADQLCGVRACHDERARVLVVGARATVRRRRPWPNFKADQRHLGRFSRSSASVSRARMWLRRWIARRIKFADGRTRIEGFSSLRPAE